MLINARKSRCVASGRLLTALTHHFFARQSALRPDNFKEVNNMADDTPNPDANAAPEGAPPQGDPNQPQVMSLAQYVKDLSVENPNAPKSYQFKGQPKIDLAFNIEVNDVSEGVHEIVLKVDAKSSSDEGVHFVIDLAYAGLFGIRGIPKEHMQPMMLVEIPRMLFPFARQIIADATIQAGFAPLLLDPIDFGAVYMQQMQQMKAQAEQAGAGGDAAPAPTGDA
ncbi:protein-export chaperone SecB [Sphingomicrobium sediminis]|uniref:Protein-export protein SecB n=1 Tax=Sphingomicrobium sediminis TaxID=2950949 RepID=A0A9X2EKJ2_9SPHN|nr:protein-export chaperone SecB [Sphingomicrobium sediminis]MCM8557072.1 protein-export chaperone SecB [Sphingomicrobium sediminis]